MQLLKGKKKLLMLLLLTCSDKYVNLDILGQLQNDVLESRHCKCGRRLLLSPLYPCPYVVRDEEVHEPSGEVHRDFRAARKSYKIKLLKQM